MFMFINVTLECFFARYTPWMKHGHSCNSTWNPKVVLSSKTFSSRPNLWASMWNLLKFRCVLVEFQKSTSFGVPGVPMKSTPSAWDLRPHGLAAVHGIHGIFNIVRWTNGHELGVPLFNTHPSIMLLVIYTIQRPLCGWLSAAFLLLS